MTQRTAPNAHRPRLRTCEPSIVRRLLLVSLVFGCADEPHCDFEAYGDYVELRVTSPVRFDRLDVEWIGLRAGMQTVRLAEANEYLFVLESGFHPDVPTHARIDALHLAQPVAHGEQAWGADLKQNRERCAYEAYVTMPLTPL